MFYGHAGAPPAPSDDGKWEKMKQDPDVEYTEIEGETPVHVFRVDSDEKPEDSDFGGENRMGRINDNLADAYDEAVENGVDASSAMYQAASQALEQTRDAEAKMSAIQTAVYELETYAQGKIGDAQAAKAVAEAQRDLMQDELSDRQDSLDHMTDDLIG